MRRYRKLLTASRRQHSDPADDRPAAFHCYCCHSLRAVEVRVAELLPVEDVSHPVDGARRAAFRNDGRSAAIAGGLGGIAAGSVVINLYSRDMAGPDGLLAAGPFGEAIVSGWRCRRKISIHYSTAHSLPIFACRHRPRRAVPPLPPSREKQPGMRRCARNAGV